MEANIGYCNFEESEIKPMEYAMLYFNSIPSIFVFNSCVLSPELYETLLSNKFDGDIRRAFDSNDEEIFKVDPSLLSDFFVTAVNIKPDFYKSFTEPKDKNNDSVVFSVYMSDDIMKYATSDKRKPALKCRVTIYYKNQSALERFVPYIKALDSNGKPLIAPDDEKIIKHNSYINLVTKNHSGSLDTSEFEIKNPKINIPLAYGSEFEAIEKQIYNTLIKSDKGLWIFHGPPGTGKSMFIRHMIKRLNKSGKVGEIIYMPSEMVGALESPDFIPFIQEYQESILVIEDGDIALESRKSHGSIVKTILQLTDGILADCLRLKIIVTFNCDLSKIDEALLRKGRLQIRHEFRVLTRTEAIELAKYLKIDTKVFDTIENRNKTDWTLAEIYNIHTDFYWDKQQKKLGFGS